MSAIETAVRIAAFLADLRREYVRDLDKHGEYASPHEGYAIVLEELDELWDQVRKRRRDRDPQNMYRECVQIAARAMKFAIGLCERPEKDNKE